MEPKIVQISTSSVVVDGDIATTVTALLDDGRVIYTGAAEGNEWHELSGPFFGPAGGLQ